MRVERAGNIMARHRGMGPGFDFLRISLSIAIMTYHSVGVSYGMNSPEQQSVGFWSTPFISAVLPCFFGLSGFLVAGSALRTRSLLTFLSFRGLRLLPALMVEVTLSALVLGPLLTEVPLSEYFSDKRFFAYFGNVVGRIRFELPGVFADNPLPTMVNGNLWTLHPELICYALMAGIIMIGLLRRRTVALGVWALATIIFQIINLKTGSFDLGANGHGNVFDGPTLVYAFATGAVAYLWADKIPMSAGLVVLAALIYMPLCYVKGTTFLLTPLVIYAMIWIGMSDRLAFPILKKGDYSYGIYLYGFVIQQTMAHAFSWARTWWIMCPLSVAAAIGFAAISWHFIEKPALRLKKLVGPRAAVVPSVTEPSLAR